MENLVLDSANVVSLDSKKQTASFLTVLGKTDPDVKEFVRLIHKFSLREKAVSLIKKKLARKKPARPTFFR